MKVGDVLNDALAGYRMFWRYLAPLALAAAVAVAALVALLIAALGEIGLIAAVVVSVVANFWIAGLLIQTVDDVMDEDGDTAFAARFEAFWPHVNTLSLAAILLSLATAPGLALSYAGHPVPGLLLIIGGIVLLTWWALVVPLIVIEQRSTEEALNRSHELVRGNAWPVFRFLFVVGLLTGLLSSAVERLTIALLPDLPALLLSTVFDTVVLTPFLALALVTLYYRLSPNEAAAPVASAA